MSESRAGLTDRLLPRFYLFDLFDLVDLLNIRLPRHPKMSVLPSLTAPPYLAPCEALTGHGAPLMVQSEACPKIHPQKQEKATCMTCDLIDSLRQGQMVPGLLMDAPRWLIPKRLNRQRIYTRTVSHPESAPTLYDHIQRSVGWQVQRDSGAQLSEIAQAEGIEIKRVTELLWLTSLPEEVVNKIKRGDSEVAEWSINQAITEARRAHKRSAVREVLEQVDAWQRQINQGVKRSEIARREGLTRARVTQLMKLSRLPKEVRRQIDEELGEDEVYSIRALIKLSSGG